MTAAFLDQIRAKSLPFTGFGSSGLYFLFHGTELVYIGQSNNCESRINQHAHKGVKLFDRYAIHRLEGDRPTRHRVECALIHKFTPKYNELPPVKNLQNTSTFSELMLDKPPLIV